MGRLPRFHPKKEKTTSEEELDKRLEQARRSAGLGWSIGDQVTINGGELNGKWGIVAGPRFRASTRYGTFDARNVFVEGAKRMRTIRNDFLTSIGPYCTNCDKMLTKCRPSGPYLFRRCPLHRYELDAEIRPNRRVRYRDQFTPIKRSSERKRDRDECERANAGKPNVKKFAYTD